MSIFRIKNKRPFFFSAYFLIFLLYMFRLASFGYIFYKMVSLSHQISDSTGHDYIFKNEDEMFKILFTAFDAPKSMQAMSIIFFMILIFHIEHECHFDKFELEKKRLISRPISPSKKP